MRISGILPALAVLVLHAGAGHASPKTEPGVFVRLSTTGMDEAERVVHTDIIRRALRVSWVQDKHVDVNVTRLSVTYVGNAVEIVAELGFVLSSTGGAGDRMASIGCQTAKLVLPRSQVNARKLPGLRREVIQSALGDLVRKLRPRVIPTV